MKKKILKNMTILIAISMLVMFGLMIILIDQQSRHQMQEMVETEAGYVKLAVEESGISYLSEQTANVSPSRLTLIQAYGAVLYDSAEPAEKMENHKARPEVKEALEKGSGKSTRLSSTMGEVTYYYALRLSDGNVLRVARTTDSVFITIRNSLIPLLLIFACVLAIAVLLTKRQTEHLVRPLNCLDLEHPLENDVYEEISPLLTRINQQNHQIAQQVEILKEKQDEYDTITENMQDGLIVTDKTEILSINKKALGLFHIKKKECIHKNILTLSRNQDLKACLDLALQGQSNNRVVEMEGGNYQFLGNPVRVDQEIRGAVIFILDVTQKAQNEKIRREFTANVSHELKTPLMSISGYAELIMNHMVSAENTPEFAGRIYQEANRLSTLVADIIKLSKLDEQEDGLPMEDEVDLWMMANDVNWQLQQKAEERNITVKLKGESVKIHGNRQLLSEIVYNLVDNAIKYNVENGKVHIHVHRKGDHAEFVVKDTGVGIAAADRERVFERFYRVDKSRSREIEGTGLGLSIVKHGVAMHKGEIKVDSALGKGTKITVVFPL